MSTFAEGLLENIVMLGAGSLWSLWVPLGAWTLLAAVVYLGLHVGRQAHPLLHSNMRTTLLLAHPLGIVLAQLVSLPAPPMPETEWPVALEVGASAPAVDLDAEDGGMRPRPSACLWSCRSWFSVSWPLS